MKTIDYSQPDFYHFSNDSIKLAEFASQYWKNEKELRVIDLFAGSGVVGIEFFYRHSSISSIEFIERESAFKKHLIRNKSQSKIGDKGKVLISDIRNISSLPGNAFILSNPPYFIEGTGRPSTQLSRQKANFIDSETWRYSLNLVKNCNLLFLGRVGIGHLEENEQVILLEKLDGKTGIFTLNKSS